MDTPTLIGNIVTGIATLAGSGILVYLNNRRKAKLEEKKALLDDRRGQEESNRKDFNIVADLIKKDNDRLRSEVDQLKQEVSSLQSSIIKITREYRLEVEELRDKLRQEERKRDDLANQLSLFETSHYDLPLPHWLKDTRGTMLSLNEAYEELFLLPLDKTRSDYLGHTDIDVWGEKIGKHYQQNDKKVYRSKKPQTFIEDILVGEDDMTEEFIVMKYPRFLGKTLIGIGGVAFPTTYYNDLKKPQPGKPSQGIDRGKKDQG